jgi:predicted hydrocarbon binding protein
MEIWRAPARGEISRAELADLKVHNTLFTTFYVQIVSLLKENYGVGGAINALREIGEGVAFSMWNFKKPKKTNSLKKIISEVSNFGFYKAVSYETREDGLLVIDKDCSICWEGVLEKDIPYCCIIDGFLEKYLLLAFDEDYDIPKVQVRVIKSKATGDEQCEHLVTSF